MKRRILALLLAALIVLLPACKSDTNTDSGNDDVKTSSKKSKNGTKNSGDQTQDEADGAESGKADSKEEIDSKKEALDVKFVKWQDGYYFGSYYENGDYVYYASDSDGEVIFNLDHDRSFDYEEGKNVFQGEYALLLDNTIINRDGETVFDMSSLDYDEIYYTECLDVGYILYSKDINTFEETGTHYFALNVETGETFRFEGDFKPMSGDHYYYFGEGCFLYAPPNMGYGGPHKWYDITTGETYDGYKYDEDGNKVTDPLVDIYFMDGFGKDFTKKASFDGMFYGKKGDFIYKYDIKKGYYEVTGFYEMVGCDESKISDDGNNAQANHVYIGQYRNEDSAIIPFIVNYKTYDCIIMDGYDSYRDIEVYRVYDDTNYLVRLTNEGGGKFVTMIDNKGNILFDPVASSRVTLYTDEYFAIVSEEGTIQIYDLEGNMIVDVGGDYMTVIGESSAVVAENGEFVLYSFDTNERIELSKDNESFSTNLLGYDNGRYIFEDFLMDDSGEIYYVVK